MKCNKRFGIGMAAMTAIGMTLVGGSVVQISAAIAGDRDAEAQAKAAAKQAKLAEKALKRGDRDEAVGRAEQAVLLTPRDGAHRALLGRAYLASGRFVSAAQAFEGALAQGGDTGGAALNLALAKVALGDWQGARQVLDANAQTIQPADRGLAIALAGDPMGAVEILSAAARDATANAKVRQNLALALALGGKWAEAKAVAAVDLAPADVDQRMMEWIQFARPVRASDQVTSLLGVTMVEDGGMPVQLALNQAQAPVAVVQAAAPVEAYVAPDGEVAPAPAAVAAVTVVDSAKLIAAAEPATPAGPQRGRIVFAARREIVQALPGGYAAPPMLARKDTPRLKVNPTVAAVMQQPATGSFAVQLGAYANAGVAREAWGRLSRSGPLTGQTPLGMNVTTQAGQFYRLSVGNMDRSGAKALCASLRARGGNCFVRANAGESVASWGRGPLLAKR